jgi:regulator of extracellular matrix RemA (YlzA/DUF370 family)
MKLIDIGYGNFISADRVVAVISPDSLPVRRLIQDAKNVGRVVDVSCGKKTKAVLITDSDHIVLSAETPEELNVRFTNEQ